MFVAVMAIVVAGFTACGNSAPKANLKTDVDTMSYALGMAQTQGLKDYLVNSLGVDTAYMSEFIKGLNEGVNAGENSKKAAYYAGIQIGQQISTRMVKGINREVFGEDSTKSISMKNFMAAFIGATTGKKTLMTMDQAQLIAQSKMREIKAREMMKTYGPNKEAGEKFLKENAKKEGVKTLDNGIQYKVLTEGTGAIPADTSLVKVNYEGRLIDGTVFDSSARHGDKPTEFKPNQVIKGWSEALTMMPVGSKWQLFIPYYLAYGNRSAGEIKPYSTLIFDVELVGIVKN